MGSWSPVFLSKRLFEKFFQKPDAFAQPFYADLSGLLLLFRIFSIPGLILILGIALLQYHSIQLWQGWTGWWSGLVWSLLLELISLWIWFLAGSSGKQSAWLGRLALYFLGGVTSAILLIGPLYQVSRPVIAELNSATAAREQTSIIKAEIEQTLNGLAVYRQNSLARLGGQRKIDEAEARLGDARRSLRTLNSIDNGVPWLRWGPLLLQGLSLVLFQIANILAISHIAKNVSSLGKERGNAWKVAGNGNGREAHTSDQIGPVCSPDSLVRALQKTLKLKLETGRISQAEFCRTHGLNPRDVSLLFHYFQNKTDGKRNVSMQFLGTTSSQDPGQGLWFSFGRNRQNLQENFPRLGIFQGTSWRIRGFHQEIRMGDREGAG